MSFELSPRAFAHKPSDSYLNLTLTNATLAGQWDIALRDLEYALGIDADDDGAITWGELKAKHADIAAYALARLQVAPSNSPPLALRVTEQLVADHTDGAYSVLRFVADLPSGVAHLVVSYRLFADLDPLHRGLFQLRQGDATHTAVFGPDRPALTFDCARPAHGAQFVQFFREGMHHIWIGIDHILFLLALLLPAVFQFVPQPRSEHSDRPRFSIFNFQFSISPLPDFRSSFLNVVKVVTAFTVAHSITLALASLRLVDLDSRFVESTIALSIIVAAANNLRPVVRGRAWLVAFGFGLIHGFGFASVLADLGLPGDALALALVAFNLGVEAGQLVIVLAFLPLAFALRRTTFYRQVIFRFGSLAIILVAAAWFVERAFSLEFMPF